MRPIGCGAWVTDVRYIYRIRARTSCTSTWGLLRLAPISLGARGGRCGMCSMFLSRKDRAPGPVASSRPFFPIIEREGEGEKRPGIYCTGGSAHAH